jgi:D-beta-D-heptose 7-phosphate kinase/D-beta-D-heptose 1-phosphate adenosyltransferase
MAFEELRQVVAARQAADQTVVFTNGCFDILHAGHVDLLEDAAREGDVLVVALNSDASVRGLKGPQRPINPQQQRARVLAALAVVDYVVLFDDPDPGRLITGLLPDVLIKGGDWSPETIIGSDVVKAYGGRVATIPLKYGASTTDIIKKALNNE